MGASEPVRSFRGLGRLAILNYLIYTHVPVAYCRVREGEEGRAEAKKDPH